MSRATVAGALPAGGFCAAPTLTAVTAKVPRAPSANDARAMTAPLPAHTALEAVKKRPSLPYLAAPGPHNEGGCDRMYVQASHRLCCDEQRLR